MKRLWIFRNKIEENMDMASAWIPRKPMTVSLARYRRSPRLLTSVNVTAGHVGVSWPRIRRHARVKEPSHASRRKWKWKGRENGRIDASSNRGWTAYSRRTNRVPGGADARTASVTTHSRSDRSNQQPALVTAGIRHAATRIRCASFQISPRPRRNQQSRSKRWMREDPARTGIDEKAMRFAVSLLPRGALEKKNNAIVRVAW